MVAPELKLTKEGAGPHCQRLWLKERRRLRPEDSASCLRTLKLTDTLELLQAVLRLHRMEERQNHIVTTGVITLPPEIYAVVLFGGGRELVNSLMQ